MIREVDYQITSYAEPPLRFEAGTPPIAQAIGLGAAIDYLQSWGWEIIMDRERALYQHLQDVLDSIPDLRKIGEATDRSSAQSFLLGQAHPYDVGLLLDSMGIAVRTGHHCAQPVMERFNVPATARASFGMYNTFKEIDTLAEAIDAETRKRLIAITAPGAGEPRLTFTLPVLAQAGRLALHIEGAEKKQVLRKALGEGPEEDMPVRAVLRSAAPVTLYWCP